MITFLLLVCLFICFYKFVIKPQTDLTEVIKKNEQDYNDKFKIDDNKQQDKPDEN